jgi:hypothetical protein
MDRFIEVLAAALFATAATASAAPSTASSCKAASGARMLPLVELYTSEGCSSCPPADRWLSSHFAGNAAIEAAVVAFHVDYWNDLGWRDRFSSPGFTERQRHVAAANGIDFVYTPQVVVQGRSVTDWRDDAGAIAALRDTPSAASIAISAVRTGTTLDVDVHARVTDAHARDGARLDVALTSDGLESAVAAGENKGVTLHHDAVVRALREGSAPDGSGALALSARFTLPGDGHASKLVAFVQSPGRGDVLQSLVLPLDSCRP